MANPEEITQQEGQKQNNFEAISKEIDELRNRDDNDNLILSDDKIDGLITEKFSEIITNDQAKHLLNQLYDDDNIDKKNELINSINNYFNLIINQINKAKSDIQDIDEANFNSMKEGFKSSIVVSILQLFYDTTKISNIENLTKEDFIKGIDQATQSLGEIRGKLRLCPERGLAHINHLISKYPTKIEIFNTTNRETLCSPLKETVNFYKDISNLQSSLEKIAYPELKSNKSRIIMNQLNNIKNKKTNDISYLLSSKFIGEISKEDAQQIIAEISSTNLEDNKQLEDLQSVLSPIANPVNTNQSLDGINQENGGMFYSGVEKASEGEETKSEVQQTKDNINTILSHIPQIEEGKQFYNEINSTKDNLHSIQTILDFPTTSNTKILQKFIYDNLPEDKRSDFETNNHYRARNGELEKSFDGQFGKDTLNSLNSVLEIIEKHIDDINSSLDIQQKADDQISKEKSAQQPQTPDQSTENEPETPVDTTPLSIGDKKYAPMENSSQLANDIGLKGAKIYTTETSEPTTKTIEPSTEAQVDAQLDQAQGGNNLFTQPEFANNSGTSNGNKEYYAKIPGKENAIYKIQLDNKGNLCPIATEFDNSFVDWQESTTLLKNNPSCITYLQSKIDDISGISNIEIKWNNKIQDYTLTSYNKTITIEPMTIAGDWVSNDLSICLKLLNLTNCVRAHSEPDFKYKYLDEGGEKKLIIKGTKRKQKVSLNKFGLGSIDDKTLNKFIKYNNHEDWNDDWDSKEANKIYKKI